MLTVVQIIFGIRELYLWANTHVNNLEHFLIAETVNADNYNAIINGVYI